MAAGEDPSDEALIVRIVSGDREAFLGSDARTKQLRERAVAVVKQASGDQSYNDANYVFPTFITTELPAGLVGLLIAAIFVAAMSASGGELNSLATATIIDFYRRYFVTAASDEHYVRVSKLATICWGLFACVVAMQAAGQGSLIEVVNQYGSLVYGSRYQDQRGPTPSRSYLNFYRAKV